MSMSVGKGWIRVMQYEYSSRSVRQLFYLSIV